MTDHPRLEKLLAEQAKERYRLEQELALRAILLPDEPDSVFNHPLYGTVGTITYKKKPPYIIPPAEKLVKLKQGIFISFRDAATAKGPPGMPVETTAIGSVIVEDWPPYRRSIKWIATYQGARWWVQVDLAPNAYPNVLGSRRLERSGPDHISYDNRPIVRQEWTPGSLLPEGITKYSPGANTDAGHWVLYYPEDVTPQSLLAHLV